MRMASGLVRARADGASLVTSRRQRTVEPGRGDGGQSAGGAPVVRVSSEAATSVCGVDGAPGYSYSTVQGWAAHRVRL